MVENSDTIKTTPEVFKILLYKMGTFGSGTKCGYDAESCGKGGTTSKVMFRKGP